MAVLRSVVLLAGAVSSLLFPVFFGHALSTHGTGPIIAGAIALVAGSGLIFLSTRMPGGTGHGH
ncbi:MAG: hypothetical protein ACREL7_14950 [Longimicrobiales bacterium]